MEPCSGIVRSPGSPQSPHQARFQGFVGLQKHVITFCKTRPCPLLCTVCGSSPLLNFFQFTFIQLVHHAFLGGEPCLSRWLRTLPVPQASRLWSSIPFLSLCVTLTLWNIKWGRLAKFLQPKPKMSMKPVLPNPAPCTSEFLKEPQQGQCFSYRESLLL